MTPSTLLPSLPFPSFSSPSPRPAARTRTPLFHVPQGLTAAQSAAELDRLEQRLAKQPTTEAEDRAELEKMRSGAEGKDGKGGKLDWKKETIMLFRAERKRSMAFRIKKLKERVEGGGEL